ncbi:PIN-like domain-containing protein [Streptomyces sp. SID1121]|uniref:PIN-like domain-containing protein n=1 Tax=Streptomyces sp. SID1121 TaxID=3425888 RepID=UPI004055D5A4
MEDQHDELPLIRRYRDWLQSEPGDAHSVREKFFTQGLVILDTNVLLNLYEYTPAARHQVLSALERVKDRLWLPHQVGLEFVRNRHRVIATRVKALNDAPASLREKLGEANRAILAASKLVQELLIKYAQDSAASDALRQQISSQSIEQLLGPWRTTLMGHIQDLKQDHDLAISTVANNDPVLPKVAELFGNQIADPPEPEVTRNRVEEAASYRYPNMIPPGFMDAGKGSPLASAGDYLIWEEIVHYAKNSAPTTHVLFVSGDVKDDWYEAPEPGRGRRPWPSLADEMRTRADAELRIETPKDFFMGVKRYLDVEIADTTYEEIGRVADSRSPSAVTEYEANQTSPPADLAVAAFRSAGLKSSALRDELDAPSSQLFQWWLIGVTVQLERRLPFENEPEVAIFGATRATTPPDSTWVRGEVLLLGEWPYRTSSWIAPWFADLIKRTPSPDRLILQRLAAQQMDLQSQ